MPDRDMIRRRAVRSVLACLASAYLAAGAMRSSDAGETGRLTREQLIGAWHLVRIEYSGPNGSTLDPFYQAGSTGLLIYDASGWMSVSIAAPRRPAFEVPAERLAPDQDVMIAASKAAAFDSYYAYDGRWDFDAQTSELVHHVVSSLLPAENGKSYAQTATLEHGRLVFSNRSGAHGAETVRRKIWERAE